MSTSTPRWVRLSSSSFIQGRDSDGCPQMGRGHPETTTRLVPGRLVGRCDSGCVDVGPSSVQSTRFTYTGFDNYHDKVFIVDS